MVALQTYQAAFSQLLNILKQIPLSQRDIDELYQHIPSEFQSTKFLPTQNLSNKCLNSLFEHIRLSDNKQQTTARYVYSVQQLSPSSIFPTDKKTEINITSLIQVFLNDLKKIPSSHKANLALWLDHFETACQCFFSSLATEKDLDVSLYDHYKIESAFQTALALWQGSDDKEDKPYLIVQGDFFGIQDFIFSGGSETNKQSAKLLRGRSFQVSLFTELAALKLLDICDLPSTSQVMNAAGKFILIAANTKRIKQKIENAINEFNQWFISNTYGLIGIGIATLAVNEEELLEQNFATLMKTLFEQLEQKKLQRFDLTNATENVLSFASYPNGICELNKYFPADNNNCSIISNDQISIGRLLTTKDRIIICDEGADFYKDNKTNKLSLPIFGYEVLFTDNEEITGKFSQLVRYNQIKRIWDISLPESLDSPIWNGYARRYINAYIPYISENSQFIANKYNNLSEDDFKSGEIKTFDYIACEDRTEIIQEGKSKFIGQTALTTLKGDIDNLGLIFQNGVSKPSFKKTTMLSRYMNHFFSLWLPAYCQQEKLDIYTVFAGGDDFFLIGPWRSIQNFAFKMQEAFEKYVAFNEEIHFSAGMVMTKLGIPVPYLGAMAEEALSEAKKCEGKNSVTLYNRSLSWKRLKALQEKSNDLEGVIKKYNISTSYIYSLIQLSKQAENLERNIENTMWRSRFFYKTSRYIVDKLKKEEKESALKELIRLLGEEGVDKYKQDFTIPLFNYFYSVR